MNGIIVIDKPADFTSFDVVAKLRGILRERRIGHGGTLDPMATGVLPVFVGTATKAVDILPDTKKSYTARVRLGIKTETGDITGGVTQRSSAPVDFSALKAAAGGFVGEIQQTPPMYSAVKVGGKKLYELARKGIEIEREPRSVEVFSLNLYDYNEATGEFSLDADCSKGTYIRTLAEDILARMGLIGALASLRRTRSADFTLNEAVCLDEVEAAAQEGKLNGLLRETETAFLSYGERVLDAKLARLFLNGFRFESERACISEADGTVRIKDEGGRFLGLGKCVEGTLVKTAHFLSE